MITDLNMPGMSGTELLGHLKDRGSEIPIGVLSGWIAPPEEGEDPTQGADFVLPKPCRVNDLLEVVQRHLPPTVQHPK